MKKGYLIILVLLLLLCLGVMIFLRKRQPEVVKSLEDFNERLIESSSENEIKIDSLETTETIDSK